MLAMQTSGSWEVGQKNRWEMGGQNPATPLYYDSGHFRDVIITCPNVNYIFDSVTANRHD